MARILAICLSLVCLASQALAAVGDDKPSKEIPELKVLEHYLGIWKTEITSKELPFTGGKVTVKKVLGGRFVEQLGDMEAKDGTKVFSVKTLMTYDTNKKVYRNWIFVSDGNTFESEGTWNAKDRVMTSIGKKDEHGAFSTTTADFSEDGFETWKIARTDGDGTERVLMSGKNTRQKK
jgi:hypothetical protein